MSAAPWSLPQSHGHGPSRRRVCAYSPDGPNRPRTHEVTAREKSREARIGPVRIPFGIDRQIYQVDVVRIAGAVQPFEDRIALAETCMHERHGVRRHVTLLRNSIQRL
jgi:hypothetical protein